MFAYALYSYGAVCVHQYLYNTFQMENSIMFETTKTIAYKQYQQLAQTFSHTEPCITNAKGLGFGNFGHKLSKSLEPYKTDFKYFFMK